MISSFLRAEDFQYGWEPYVERCDKHGYMETWLRKLHDVENGEVPHLLENNATMSKSCFIISMNTTWKNTTWLNIVLFQVIYKKTILPCPLPFFYHNSANLSMNASHMPGLYPPLNSSAQMDFSRADVSPAVLGSHDAHHSTGVHVEPHPDDEEMCTPKYFVFNSQVRCGFW